ncbi:MAG TPA: tetratricopeptide repeat protein, partial [Thermoanaerobaculia bacterium]|nr:tetratricopeptide repeat protein [Thermoanaerobaculia bacterium]
MMKAFPAARSLALCLALPLLASPVLATCGGGGGGGVGGMGGAQRGGGLRLPSSPPEVYQVPWKTLQPGDAAPAGLLVLYWFPASAREQRSSELQDSRPLTLAATKCVGLAAVGSDHAELREKYKVVADVSTAVLVLAPTPANSATPSDPTEVARVQGKDGRPLGRDEVERLLKDGMKRQDRAAAEQLDAARAKADHGDKDGAIALYGQVWEQRCLVDGPAKKAAKALKKLGHPVPEELSRALPVPDQRPATRMAIQNALAKGLAAEEDLRIPEAQRDYEAARKLDPADPVPLRFLGELYRHHVGDWARARATFQQILAMPADPLSRAVALHGLGKMTIHEGDFAKGLGMFEQSVATYPLALTYRNLAVYWSSEGQADKAYGYVKQAMALDPEDEYNQIFAATFLVKLGRPEEAAQVASAHESVLAASYNLAAIWAQL